jgi:Rod binding domain-containing protein
MDSSEITLNTSSVLSNAQGQSSIAGITATANSVQSSDATSATGKKTEQAAKDFESVLLTKVLEGMENTVNQFSAEDEEEAGSEQIKGMFTLFLARDMADKGGLGLWKDLNAFFKDMQKKNTASQSVDEKL